MKTQRIKTAVAITAGVVVLDYCRDWKWTKGLTRWFAQQPAATPQKHDAN